MIAKQKPIGELLQDAGLIDSRDLNFALAEKHSNEKLLEALHRLGLLDGITEQAYAILAENISVPFLIEGQDFQWSQDIISIIDQETAQSHLVLPLKKDSSFLWLGMQMPQDIAAIESLRVRSGVRVRAALITPQQYSEGLEQLYGISNEERQQVIKHKLLKKYPEDQKKVVSPTTKASSATSKHNDQMDYFDLNDPGETEGAALQLFRSILSQAIVLDSSDIHCEPGRDETIIRYRIDGVLHEQKRFFAKYYQPLITSVKVLAGMDISERRLPQDGRISVHYENQEIDLRLSTLPSVFGEKLVLRLLRRGTGLLRLDRLGIDPITDKILRTAIEEPNGIILVTGPTGSGKSTTLYSLLRELDLEHLNVITIEEPVEYQMSGVTQVDVKADIGLDFSSILRTVLRQDPDVIMLGEVRDAETAEMAIRSALTGHLVLSTLHTNSAPATIDRLIDMGMSPYLLAASIRLIAAQRLVRRICPECASSYKPEERHLSLFPEHDFKDIQFVKGSGCSNCNHIGYKGRLALLETLIIKDDLIRSMASGMHSAEIKNEAQKLGLFDSIDRSGLLAVGEGKTTLEEIVRIKGGL